MGFGVHLCDHAAGGLLKRGGNKGVDQRAKRGGEEFQAEPTGKERVLQVGFIHTARVIEKNFVEHGVSSLAEKRFTQCCAQNFPKDELF